MRCAKRSICEVLQTASAAERIIRRLPSCPAFLIGPHLWMKSRLPGSGPCDCGATPARRQLSRPPLAPMSFWGRVYSVAARGHLRAAAGCEFADMKGGAQQHHPAARSRGCYASDLQDEATGESREVNAALARFADAAPSCSATAEPAANKVGCA